MGFFGEGKQVSVSSVVYNLAGDEEDRVDYLKTTVLAKILTSSPVMMGEHIVASYLGGPGIKLRRFGRWGDYSGYNAITGLTPGELQVGDSIDDAVLAGEIPHPPGSTVSITDSVIGVAAYTYWAEQYLYAFRPDKVNDDYVTTFNSTTFLISFLFSDLTTDSVVAAGYVPTALYLYSRYNIMLGTSSDPVVPGTLIILATGAPFPSTVGWTTNSFTTTPTPLDLDKVVLTEITYSDATPPSSSTVTTTTSPTYAETAGEYERTTYMGSHPTRTGTWSNREIMYQWQTAHAGPGTPVVVTVTEDIGGGVIKTTKTTTTEEVLILDRSYRIDTQTIMHDEMEPTQVFIYRQDSGNPTLDAMFTAPIGAGEYFPYIPIRIDNKMINDTFKPEIYPWVKKAFKKSINGRYDKIVQDIQDNPKIADIDYVHAMFGVSLSTKENTALQYVYELFQELLLGAEMGSSTYDAWKLEHEAAEQAWIDYLAWQAGQIDPGDPLYGTPPPPSPGAVPYPPSFGLRVQSGFRTDLAFDQQINWNGLEETVGSGLKKLDAKPGDLWFEKLDIEEFDYYTWGDIDAPYYVTTQKVEHLQLHWQVDEDTWRTLDIWGLIHANRAYGSNVIAITGFEAVDTPEGDCSGFIIPLHTEIYKRFAIIPGTQMATACCYLVFTCVTIVKEKWYETVTFKILVIIVAIALAAIMGPIVGATGMGILGTNIAIGTALGLTGSAALIAGAVVNAVAAIILTEIISRVSVGAFGPKIGPIVAAVVTMVAMNVGTALASGATAASAFDNLMTMSNLMKLTSAIGNAYAGFTQGGAQDVMRQAQTLMQQYATEGQALSEQQRQVLGDGNPYVDPLTLTDATPQFALESPQTFMSRTLMTGPEMAEMSNGMIGDFASLTINTDLPGA
jgi:hypothetical protein